MNRIGLRGSPKRSENKTGLTRSPRNLMGNLLMKLHEALLSSMATAATHFWSAIWSICCSINLNWYELIGCKHETESTKVLALLQFSQILAKILGTIWPFRTKIEQAMMRESHHWNQWNQELPVHPNLKAWLVPDWSHFFTKGPAWAWRSKVEFATNTQLQ